MNTYTCNSIVDAKIILYNLGIKVNNCYKILFGEYNYSLGLYVYFNFNKFTKAYYIPIMNTITILKKPEMDMTTESRKFYIDRNIKFE